MKKDIIIGALLLILGFVIGILCRPHHIREVTEKVTDTLVVRDTHIIEKPVLIERTSKETLQVAVHDTTRIHDTLYIALPMETKTYKGEEYYAEISGYKPSLDRIEVYPKTKIVKESITQSVTNRNALRLGVEANYCSTLSTPIYLEYERMLQRNIGINAGLFYDLQLRQYGVKVGINVQMGW